MACALKWCPQRRRQLQQALAPKSHWNPALCIPSLPRVLTQAIAAKQQIAQSLMKQNPAFFGVGVGQSLDDPKEAALVIYVDRRASSRHASGHDQWPAHALHHHGPAARHALISDGPVRQQSHCMSHPAADQPFDPLQKIETRDLNLF